MIDGTNTILDLLDVKDDEEFVQNIVDLIEERAANKSKAGIRSRNFYARKLFLLQCVDEKLRK